MAMAVRTFEDSEAVQSRVPLWVGLVGPSSSGKTYSALELATGIQEVNGGDIFMVDTESRRGLHYARNFKYRHVPFGEPFNPLAYLQVLEYCAKKKAGVIIVDSFSHEHEGPGGVLEMHEAELDRLAGTDYKKRAAMTMLAWAKPKAERRKMIQGVLQLDVSVICCFRAKEKLKIKKGEEPQHMGFMPIAGEEFMYEMTTNILLPPKSGGIPKWESDEIGERATIKLPGQFRELFAEDKPLSRDHGESMARWANGGSISTFDTLRTEVAEMQKPSMKAMGERIEGAYANRAINRTERDALRSAFVKRKSEITAVAEVNGSAPAGPRTFEDSPASPPSDAGTSEVLAQEEPGAEG
jgi:hypothetical protein